MKKHEIIENLDNKLNKLLDDSLIAPEKMKELIAHYCISGIYNYSFYNSILIMLQGGKLCQSFKGWKKLERYVKKGEHSNIFVCVPFFKKVKEKDINGNEVENERLVYFGYGRVFDISQTDGKPLEYDHNSNENLSYEYADIKEKIGKISKRVIREDYSGNARGFVNEEEIVISDMSNNVDKIKTLIHEIAHDNLGHVGNSNKSRSAKEVEAEAVAGLVLSYLNIEFGLEEAYVKNWKNKEVKIDIDKIKILKSAEKIIKSINVEKKELKKVA